MSFVAVQAFSSDNIKKNNLKTTVLSYITGSAKITYERALFEGQSVEITAGRIGKPLKKYLIFKVSENLIYEHPIEI